MVLFTGRLTEHKGVEYLIKAARQIRAEIVILGDGPERKYLESLILKYKLRQKMGERAFKTVIERFSWEKIAARFYNLYNKTLQKKMIS